MNRLVDELKLLTEIGSAMLDGQDLDSTLNLITEKTNAFFKADYCCICLLDENDYPRIKSLHGFSPDEKEFLVKRLIEKHIDRESCAAIKLRNIIVFNELDNAVLSDEMRDICKEFEVKSAISAPIFVDDKPAGSINVWHKDKREFDNIIIDEFKLFAQQVAVAVKNAGLAEGNRNLTIDIMRSLANAIDARDVYTANHSDRVSKLAVALAQELGLSQPEIQKIEYAGLLHDIGKIGIDGQILNKPDRLSIEEMELMKQHTIYSANIIRPIEFLKDVIPIVLHHHEWFNGQGYPAGLAGERIPYGARILAVADALEAMTSNRPYREALDFHEGAKRLRDGTGVQFDPTMVEAMLRVIGRIEFVKNFDSADGAGTCEYNVFTEFKDAI